MGTVIPLRTNPAICGVCGKAGHHERCIAIHYLRDQVVQAIVEIPDHPGFGLRERREYVHELVGISDLPKLYRQLCALMVRLAALPCQHSVEHISELAGALSCLQTADERQLSAIIKCLP